MKWSPHDILKAVRDRLALRDGWDFSQDVRAARARRQQGAVNFRVEDQRRFGVYYDLAEAPNGTTGEPAIRSANVRTRSSGPWTSRY
jgi:hypothetical protein